MATILEILADVKLGETAKYGFTFELENLAKNGVTLKQVPVLHVTDYKKFDAEFGCVLEHVNGTSTHVGSQRVGRDFAWENQKMDVAKRDEAIHGLNIQWLKGVKSVRTLTVTVFAGPEGKSFETEDEAKQAWLEWASQQ